MKFISNLYFNCIKIRRKEQIEIDKYIINAIMF